MKLSERTIKILRNFANIHASLIIKPGSIIATAPPSKRILARAQLVEEFEKQMAFYDLPKFLGVLSLFKDPDVTFHDTWASVSEGKRRVNYTYAAETEVISAPLDGIKMPAVDISLPLSQQVQQDLVKAAGTLGLTEVAFTGKEGKVFVELINSTKPTSNIYAADLEVETDKKFQIIFRLDNFNFIQQDYTVDINFARVAHFKGADIEYWLPREENSKVG